MHLVRQSLLLVAAAPLFATTAFAQQRDTAKVAPVVVTATRVPITVAASPATIDVITGDALRLRGVTSVAAALDALPGVTFAQSGSFGSTTSLFLRGGESKYVKVLIDGVAVNDPGGAFDFGSLTTDNVERIELVRGPASVLYGADAVTGVIQIFTRRGQGKPRTVLSARGGSYGTSDQDATVLGAFTTGDFSVALARHGTSGIYDFNNAYHSTVASGGVHLLVDPSTDLRVSLRYNDDEFHYPTNGGGTQVDSNAHRAGDRTTLSVEVGHVFAPRFDAHLSLTSQASSGATDDRPDKPSGNGTQSLDRIRRRGAELRTNLDLAQTIVTTGMQLEQQDQRSESEFRFGSSASTSIFEASRRNKALYVQALSTLPDSIVLTFGGRVDDNERFGTFGTYRVGGSWRAIGGTHVRASAGTAFREPSFFENYASGFVTGNRDLLPERSAAWEIGIRHMLLSDRVTVGVTQFTQRFRKMIDYTGSTKYCGASYCNIARAQANGREFELRVNGPKHLSADANLTHLETKVIEPGFDSTANGLYRPNDQLVRRPATEWNAGLSYVSAIGSADLRVMHVGRRADRDYRGFPALVVVDPAHTRTDLGASLSLESLAPRLHDADITLRVENVFDVTYQSIFNFRTPRRTVLGGARVAF